MQWEGKVALVTGASRGVGAAVARALAKAGANVAVAARSTGSDGSTIERTLGEIEALGARGLAVPTDLADEEQTRAMVERTADHFGRLDMLVNNAALTGTATDLFSDLELMRKAAEVDFWAPLIAARAAVPHMRKTGGGRILNVTSLVGLEPVANLMMYGVCKLALERLTLDFAVQLKGDGIACNAFRIDLPVRDQAEFAAPRQGLRAKNLEFAEPAEVAAQGILWMLSRPADYTGRLESMRFLREREGIMASRAKRIFPLRKAVCIAWP